MGKTKLHSKLPRTQAPFLTGPKSDIEEVEAGFQKHEKESRLSTAERNQRIWEDIVAYVNADLAIDAKGCETLLEVLLKLTPYAGHFPPFRGADNAYHDLPKRGESTHSYFHPSGQSIPPWFPSEATLHQKDLRNLLLWLCKPKAHPELRVKALEFLETNTKGEDWYIDRDEDPIEVLDFDEGRGECPFLYFAKQVFYTSTMSPVCKFIFSQVEVPPKTLPLRFCKRPTCERFFVPARSDKLYCSDLCRAMDHPKDKSEMKDYQYLRRLEKLSEKPEEHGLVRLKLRTNADRITKIEARWKEWAPEKILRVKKNVGIS